MFKFVVLAAILAVAAAAPSPGLVGTPLLAKLAPAPEAPANTEHATHVSATLPLVRYAPLAYSAPLIAPGALTYAGGYLAYQPLEAHGYRFSY